MYEIEPEVAASVHDSVAHTPAELLPLLYRVAWQWCNGTRGRVHDVLSEIVIRCEDRLKLSDAELVRLRKVTDNSER